MESACCGVLRFRGERGLVLKFLVFCRCRRRRRRGGQSKPVGPDRTGGRDALRPNTRALHPDESWHPADAGKVPRRRLRPLPARLLREPAHAAHRSVRCPSVVRHRLYRLLGGPVCGGANRISINPFPFKYILEKQLGNMGALISLLLGEIRLSVG